MSDLELWVLIGQIGLVLLAGGFVGWLCRRRPYRDGRRAEIWRDTQTRHYPGIEVISEEDMTRPLPTETHAEFIGVPCDPGLDYGRLADALNRKDTSVTDNYKPQGDDHTGGPAGII
jgi:hypothetical protein